MRWLLLSLGFVIASQIWLSFKVGRSNSPLAVATFFIGFPAALYTFFRHRSDPQTSVTAPIAAASAAPVVQAASAASAVAGPTDWMDSFADALRAADLTPAAVASVFRKL